ncbi:MAG: alpha-(1-_3)-arabinofuranosyltransferase domain-containing protein [Nocardioidaceae bacterium]
MRTSATSPLRMWGYGLVLAAIAFVQTPGRIVGDTKFDLVAAPMGFLQRATHLWDPISAFGQIQNQAYGYFWPMGPFFVLGHLSTLPPWIVQRLWWTLLLCLAFFGVVRLCQRLEIGQPWTRVLAGFAFALSPHMLTLLGATSVEAWPSALAPWVLLPLVKGSREGSERRAAALSALVVATCGGVNAVAVSAVLPLGVLWILTRARGRRRTVLFAWWIGLTALATLWWTVPLLIMGSYSPPFLDYIENAPITTLPTGLGDVLNGTSDWVAYISPENYPAGHMLATTVFLIIDAAVITALGLAGISRTDNPHRRFLLAAVVVGVFLVAFGYTGEIQGWWAEDRLSLLDGGLAAFRNLHKYDVVLRLALVLGMAHVVSQFQADAVDRGALRQRLAVRSAAVFALAGIASPAYAGLLAPSGGMVEIPPYWRHAAHYLAEHSDGGVALELPAAPFGDYAWGSPHDDVLQPLAEAPWAVRNVVPLAPAGNVVFLDAVTRTVERGRPSPNLAEFLAANGVSRLVVRNDVDRGKTGAPDPVILHQALDLSDGLEWEAGFGPMVGEGGLDYVQNGVRVVRDRGLARRYRAVEIYKVSPPASTVAALPADDVPVLVGDPGGGLVLDEVPSISASGTYLLAGDVKGHAGSSVILTDGLKNREKSFAAVRHNESATMQPHAPRALTSVEPNHRIYERQARWQTTESWDGIRKVRASSSQGFADGFPPLRPSTAPAAALDSDPSTQWESSLAENPRGQWWRVGFTGRLDVSKVRVTMGRSPLAVERLTLVSGRKRSSVDAPPPGETRTYRVDFRGSSGLAVAAEQVREPGPRASFALAEVDIPGLEPRRWLKLPRPPRGRPVGAVVLQRDQGQPGCAEVWQHVVCDDLWAGQGEEGDLLAREFTLPQPGTYGLGLAGSPRQGPAASAAVLGSLPIRIEATKSYSDDLRSSPLAMLDRDLSTTWVGAPNVGLPSVTLTWKSPVTLRSLRVALNRRAAGAAPTQLLLGWGDESRTVHVDAQGRARFRPIRTDRLTIGVTQVEDAYTISGLTGAKLPVGISELSLSGEGDILPDLSNQAVGEECGSGPDVLLNGDRLETAVDATVDDLLSGAQIPLRVCGSEEVALPRGTSAVIVAPTDLIRPDVLTFVDDSEWPSPTPVYVFTKRWGETSREVRVEARREDSLLVVRENFNAGWTATLRGRRLPPQRVDGWQQGWWVPAGAAGTVTLEFAPDEPYRRALWGGAVGAAVVLGAALLPARRRARPGLATGLGSRLEWLLVIGAFGLIAGWVGAALSVLALVASLLLPSEREWVSPASGWLMLAAGLVMAATRDSRGLVDSAPVQLLAVLALLVACLALPANGPAFLRRRKGRSTNR